MKNNKHIYEGGPYDGMTSTNFLYGKPHEVNYVDRDGYIYRWVGRVNEDGYRVLEFLRSRGDE